MIEAAIFDWGGVLAAGPAPSTRRRLERQLGVPAGALRGFFEPGRYFDLEEWVEVTAGRAPEAEFWRAVCARFPVRPSAELAAAAFDALLLAPARPAVVALVAGLRGRCRLALLSNATTSLRRAVEPLRLFDEVLISAEVGLRKPDPAVFRAAVARLATRPERTLFVDDADYNVRAASAEGLLAHRYRRLDGLRRWLRGLGL